MSRAPASASALALMAFVMTLLGFREMHVAFIHAFSPTSSLVGRPSANTRNLNPRYVSQAESDDAQEVVELLRMQKAVKMNPSVSDLSSILPVVMVTKIYPRKGPS